MSYTRHHCIIIVGIQLSHLRKIQKIAKEIFYPQMVSPVMCSPTNGYRSLYIAPDGSNQGWDTSNEFDARREEFYTAIKDFDHLFYITEVTIDQEGKHSVRKINREEP
jgi:formate-dependent phosphoribosylglycinamide formyltransferase (GAR transformylase)